VAHLGLSHNPEGCARVVPGDLEIPVARGIICGRNLLFWVMIGLPGYRRLPPFLIHPTRDPSRIGRLVAIGVGLTALALVPWMIYLGFTLPHRYVAGHWSLLWIGFDVIEFAVLASIAWMTWKRRQMMGAMALIAGTLLLSDAWFDVVTSWGGQGSQFTLMTALVVELPLAVFMYWLAFRAIQRTRTAGDALLSHSDPGANQVLFGPPSTPRSQTQLSDAPVRSPDRLIEEVRSLSSELHDALVDLSRIAIESDVERSALVQVHDAVEQALDDILVPTVDADWPHPPGSSQRRPCGQTSDR
jgi:hypothetical protein